MRLGKVGLLAFALASVGPIGATTAYLRSGTPAGFQITNCTNTTPIVCTTSAAHGLTHNDIVVIANVYITTGWSAANGIRRAQTTGYASNQFALKTVAGVDVAGNGTYDSGATVDAAQPFHWGGKAVAYTLKDHPRVLFDGPTGEITRAWRCAVVNSCLTSIVVAGDGKATITRATGHHISAGSKVGIWNASVDTDLNGTYTVLGGGDAPTSTTYKVQTTSVTAATYNESLLTVSEIAQTDNEAWNAIVTVSDAFTNYTVKAQVINAQRHLSAALRWYVDRSYTTGLTIARAAITGFEGIHRGAFVCTETTDNCGNPATCDFSSLWVEEIGTVYSILKAESQLTAGEITTFAGKVLTDLTDTCTKQSVTQGPGTIVSVVGTAVTGSNTAFTSLSVGDVLYLAENQGPVGFPITAITDDTHATIERNIDATPYGSGLYYYARQWSTGRCGFVWHVKHHAYHPLSAPKFYPTLGGNSLEGTGVTPQGNLTNTKILGEISLYLALADDDARALASLEYLAAFFHDFTWRFFINAVSGPSQSGTQYHLGRTGYQVPMTARILTNSVTSGPSYLGGDWLKRMVYWNIIGYVPASVFNNDTSGTGRAVGYGGEGGQAWSYHSDGGGKTAVAAMGAYPTSDEAKLANWFIRNKLGYTASNVGSFSGETLPYAAFSVLPWTGSTNQNTLSLQRLFHTTDYSNCATLGLTCDSTLQIGMMLSRTGWASSNDTLLYVDVGDNPGDHHRPTGSFVGIYKGADNTPMPCLLGGDSADCMGYPRNASDFPIDAESSSIFHIGYPNDWRWFALGDGHYGDLTLLRWAGTNPTGPASGEYAYALTHNAGAYNTGGLGASITRGWRHALHLKKSGEHELIVVYDNGLVTTAKPMRTWWHYSNKASTTCGGGTCSTSSITNNVISQSATNTLITSFLKPAGSTSARVYVDATNGTYPNGRNISFRVTGCPSTNGTTCADSTTYELISVHRVAAGTGDTALSLTALAPSSDWTGFEHADYIVLFNRTGTTSTSVPSFTASGSRTYFISGLSPGTYKTTCNGPDDQTGLAVTGGDNTLYFAGTCTGTVTIISTSEVSISVSPTTVTLNHGGTQDFTETVNGTGNTSVTWSLSGVGSLNTTTGEYAAPNPIAVYGTATVTVCSVADSSKCASAVITLNGPVPQPIVICGTGKNAAASCDALAADASTDLNWTMTTSADGSFPGPNAKVVSSGVFPFPFWMANGSSSKWISARADTGTGNASGDYVFRTTFSLTGLNPDTAQLSGNIACDNAMELFLNNASTGATCPGDSTGFSGFRSFSITSGFTSGSNTLEARVNNAGAGPVGVRVEVSGTAAVPFDPETDITLNVTPSSLSFTCVWNSGNNPANQTLTFTTTPPGVLDHYAVTEVGSAAWLSESPTSGTLAENITVSVNCTGLSAGTHNETIRISSNTVGVANTPVSIPVTLTVTETVSVSIAPTTATLNHGGTQDFTETVTGSANTSVTWSRTPALGSIDSNGLYTAPNPITASATVTVTACSVADATKCGSATVTLNGPALQAITIFGTGLTDLTTLASNGATDTHWTLTTSADGSFPGPNAKVVDPTGSWLFSFWMPQSTSCGSTCSKWIAPRSDAHTGNVTGNYVFRTTFSLTGLNPATASLTGQWACDNAAEIYLNNVGTGNTCPATESGFNQFRSFTISSGFQADTNTLEVRVNNNGAGPVGTRMEVSGTAAIPEDPETEITLNVSPVRHDFACTAGGDNPSNQTSTFSSSGGALDNYTYTKLTAAAWLTITPGSGTTAANQTLAVDCTGLSAATYNVTVRVASSTSGVVNTPVDIPVELVVSAAASGVRGPTQVGGTNTGIFK